MGDVDAHLAAYGLVPSDADLPAIRAALAEEVRRERVGYGREEARTDDPPDLARRDGLALLCAVQLFAKGHLDDVLPLWRAKRASMDLGAIIDVQLLCGAGLARTKAYLAAHPDGEARDALAAVAAGEAGSDFDGFAPAGWLDRYRAYFGVA